MLLALILMIMTPILVRFVKRHDGQNQDSRKDNTDRDDDNQDNPSGTTTIKNAHAQTLNSEVPLKDQSRKATPGPLQYRLLVSLGSRTG